MPFQRPQVQSLTVEGNYLLIKTELNMCKRARKDVASLGFGVSWDLSLSAHAPSLLGCKVDGREDAEGRRLHRACGNVSPDRTGSGCENRSSKLEVKVPGAWSPDVGCVGCQMWDMWVIRRGWGVVHWQATFKDSKKALGSRELGLSSVQSWLSPTGRINQ